MKVRPSVKKMCEKCKIIKRKGKVMVIIIVNTSLGREEPQCRRSDLNTLAIPRDHKL